MAGFNSPRRRGNVVHRLEFEAIRGRRARRKRLIGSPEPLAPKEIVPAEPTPNAVPAPAPEPAATEDGRSAVEIDRLERRLEKLARLLDERDREILSLAERGGDSEAGVASIYREVQGIRGRGKEAKQKRDVMSRIFEANLKLRERVRPASS